MSPIWTTIFSVVGAVIASYGTWCAGSALLINRKAHGASVWRPRAAEAVRRARQVFTRRRGAPTPANATIALAGSASASGHVSAPLVQFDPTVEGRLKSMQVQIDNLQTAIEDQHRRAQDTERRLDARIDQQVDRLRAADLEIKTMTKDVAVATSSLQLRGLFFVGLGTVLMAVPGMVAAIP